MPRISTFQVEMLGAVDEWWIQTCSEVIKKTQSSDFRSFGTGRLTQNDSEIDDLRIPLPSSI